MALTKPEITISQLVVQVSNEIVTATPIYVSRFKNSNGTNNNTEDLNGSAKSKLAAIKPEITI